MPTDTAAVADRFTAALAEAERSGDPQPLAELFTADAELTNLAKPEPSRGAVGARGFWADYLKAFGNIRSEFDHKVMGDTTAVLEWTSEGTLPTGKPIRYRGVSILEVRGDRVGKFRTYYDTAAFVTPAAEPNGGANEGDEKPAAANPGRPVPDRPRAAVADEQPAPAGGTPRSAGGRTHASPQSGASGSAD
jgi:ketosteroid isomerase-like protein